MPRILLILLWEIKFVILNYIVLSSSLSGMTKYPDSKIAYYRDLCTKNMKVSFCNNYNYRFDSYEDDSKEITRSGLPQNENNQSLMNVGSTLYLIRYVKI